MAQILVAKQSAVTTFEGRSVVIRRGVTRIEEGHPLVGLLPHLFEPVESAVHFRSETARQEPTAPRTRRTRRGSKKVEAPKAEKAAEVPAEQPAAEES